ncbi:MAG: hypothetical protein EXR69_02775 [Myxococcales bacterium]|nr:hypothetical protein [Myxococcales bacterium]
MKLSESAATSRPIPQPTEHVLDEDAEKHGGKARRAWFEEMHRHPPDVDWRAVEAQNGRAQMAKRSRLAEVRRAPGSPWVERGSWNQSGSMHITRPSTDGAALYAGSDLGGIWKGSPAGGDWQPVGDNLYGGVHWLELVPGANPDDPDAMIAATNGGSIHRSDDDGATWSPVEAAQADGAAFTSIRRLLSAPSSDPTRPTLYLVGGGRGAMALYRSADGGLSFEPIYDLGSDDGDVWVPRTGLPAGGYPTLYLLDGDTVQFSEDAGDTWTALASTGSGRSIGEISGSEAGSPRLWVTQYSGGSSVQLFRSDDAGGSWTELGAIDDYWGTLNTSSVDPDLLAFGGVELWKSYDAGATFTKQNGWDAYYGDPDRFVHADIMGIDVAPDGVGGEVWYVNCHGGVYVSNDALENVHNLSLTGMRVSQYYSTQTSLADPTHIHAGAQDQGYQVTNTEANTTDDLDFDQILSGDYGHLTSGDSTHRRVFSVYPGFIVVTEGEARPAVSAYLDFPPDEVNPWLPVVLADPVSPDDFWFGGSRLYRYRYNGNTWKVQEASEENFGRGGGYLSALAVSPVDPNRMYAATSTGGLYVSNDHGVSWTKSNDTAPGENYYYGNALVASALHPDVGWVGGSGYDGAPVWRTIDGGVNWSAWSDGLPATMAYTLAESRDGSMFTGTDTAAYMRTPGSAAWEDITLADAPITVWWNAEALPAENTIRFATYGRGIWDYRIGDGPGVCLGQDVDGDGASCRDDCDDTDPDRAPGAEEICGDAVDQDCDGIPDPCALLAPRGSGCGCSATGDASFGWFVIAAVQVGRRRRRFG